jgi:hypothetical protein
MFRSSCVSERTGVKDASGLKVLDGLIVLSSLHKHSSSANIDLNVIRFILARSIKHFSGASNVLCWGGEEAR